MTTAIDSAKKLAVDIADGCPVREVDFQSINWDEAIDVDANMNYLWLAIRKFFDDEDIRRKDAQYDAVLRESVKNTLHDIDSQRNV